MNTLSLDWGGAWREIPCEILRSGPRLMTQPWCLTRAAIDRRSSLSPLLARATSLHFMPPQASSSTLARMLLHPPSCAPLSGQPQPNRAFALCPQDSGIVSLERSCVPPMPSGSLSLRPCTSMRQAGAAKACWRCGCLSYSQPRSAGRRRGRARRCRPINPVLIPPIACTRDLIGPILSLSEAIDMSEGWCKWTPQCLVSIPTSGLRCWQEWSLHFSRPSSVLESSPSPPRSAPSTLDAAILAVLLAALEHFCPMDASVQPLALSTGLATPRK